LSRIVNGGKSDRHIIKPYQFKSLDDVKNEDNEFKKVDFSAETKKPQEENDPPITQNSPVPDSEVVERLLEKIEELSNNIIKSQMEFEKEIKNCYNKCEEEKQKIYNEVYEKAKQEAKVECEAMLNETKKLYEDSIAKLQEVNKKFEEQINNLEKELTSVALDMAKEIIQKELSKDSNAVAHALAKSLMEDLKEASKITLKVNPKNAEFLKGKFDNIEIIPDEAVKEGGVVILSDIGNIDGNIHERFKALKEAIEGNE
jgi:flagellar assembly protein FliH